ncbi:hypothetical protein FRC12_009994 [Ceratobasidium sp. 428]|nr:hypothetical protein FRC12_009994 [Ceratobasidium sp. 428]
MSTSSKLASSSSVFNTPELLVLICHCLTTGECVPLLTTSRVCFPIAASRIWAEVDNARVLLALVGINPVGNNHYESSKDHSHIELSRSSDFKRFNVYAPLVRLLMVYGKEHRHFKVSNWHILFRRARKGPLLPNLFSIILSALDSAFAVDQMLWVTAFASPSLIQFRPIYIRDSNKAHVSELAAAIILKTISDRCPNMQSLGIYPKRENNPADADGESCLLNMMWPGPYLPYLQSLLSLRSFSASLSVIDGDGLLVLGGLPQLGKLTISGCNEHLEDKHFVIPEGSFPRLTSLTLEEIYASVVEDLMAVKPLIRRLTHLSIRHWFEEERAPDEQVAWLEETIPLLLQHTPDLENLYYDATYNIAPFTHSLARGGISHSFLESTSKIKLRKLHLLGLEIQTIGVLERVPASWSMLTNLCLIHGSISPAFLQHFAKLPNLQALGLQLQLTNHVDWPVFDGKNVGLALRHIVNSENRVELDAGVAAPVIARSLLSLWPNLCLVSWSAVEKSRPPGPVLPSRRLLDELNACIAHAPREPVVAQAGMDMPRA